MTKTSLIVSLAVNALLLGFIIGHLSGHSNEHHKRPCKNKSIPQILELRHELFQGVKNKRKEVFNVLTADEFDPELYEAKTHEMHLEYRKIARAMTDYVKEKASTLNKEERIELANELRMMRHHRHRQKHGHKD